MTQPTAVQLRELVDAFNAEADKYAERRWIDPRMPSEVAHAMGAAYRDSSKRLYALLAASEPAPEPQGGGCKRCGGDGRRWNEAAQEVTECGACKAQLAAAIAELDEWIAHAELIDSTYADCVEVKHLRTIRAALTPKPSTPQAESVPVVGGEDESWRAIRMLVAAGFVEMAKVDEAFAILRGLAPGPLTAPQADGEGDVLEVREWKLANAMWRMFSHGKDNNPVSAQCEVQALGMYLRGRDITAWHHPSPSVLPLAASKAPAEVMDVLYTAEEVAEAMEVLRGRHGSSALVDDVLDEMESVLTAALRPTSTTRAGEG